MAYSNSYNFQSNTLVADFIISAFERCGIFGNDVLGVHSQSGMTSLNFLLSEWADKGFNLFTVEKAMFQINIGQPSYLLPASTIETPEVTASNNLRLLGGMAFSSAGGNANNAFTGNPTLACTQTSPNGYISYIYPTNSNPCVFYVGVQSNISTNYTLVIEYSLDNIVWYNNLTTASTNYPYGQIVWWVVQTPIEVQAIRIRETGGNVLNIQEIYFSQPTYSRYLTAISREEYITYPNKLQQATPSSFYLDRQVQPSMTLWPNPDNSYQTIVYNRSVQIQDITSLNQNIQIPQRFMKACLFSLAADMAIIYKPDRFPMLKRLADEAFVFARMEDVEAVPMRVYPNIYPT